MMFFELITPELKGILGEMDDDGVVTFAIEAGEGSSIRGTEMFNRMMTHFGDEVRAIHGVWLKKSADRISTNIDKVNELTGAGMGIEDAIKQAWTSTRAAKLGFGKVRLHGDPVGKPGSYTRIQDRCLDREMTAMNANGESVITPEVIGEMREAALRGAKVRELVGIIQQHLGCSNMPTIPVLAGFVHAFNLPLLKVLPIREWIGTDRDQEIDELILPEIEKAKDRWLQPQ